MEEPKDELLSLDMSFEDCYYRIRRDAGDSRSSVIYVFVKDLDILPKDNRTYGPDIIRELGKRVDIWKELDWTTLTVFKADDGSGRIEYLRDKWQPHSIPPHVALDHLPRVNVLDLRITKRRKNRVCRVQRGDNYYEILKICPFEYEVPYMKREMEAYKELQTQGCGLVPTITAYVFERTEEYIIGFLCEELQGPFANMDNYGECVHALKQFHSYGVVHGDLNRYNIIITAIGPRIIDLEKAVLRSDGDKGITYEKLLRLQCDEADSLKEVLSSEDGWGKPWH